MFSIISRLRGGRHGAMRARRTASLAGEPPRETPSSAESVRDAGRVVEILTAITNNCATAEQLHTLVQLPSGAVKFWADVTPEELRALRRAHAF